jgi:uncharacterized membrane protein
MIEIIPNWHPVFVHFPIAFATTAVLFVVLGILFKAKPWTQQSQQMTLGKSLVIDFRLVHERRCPEYV